MKNFTCSTVILALQILFVSCGNPQPEVTRKVAEIPLPDSTVSRLADTLQCGETRVEVLTAKKGKGGFVFVNLHEDETTSIEAAQKYVADSGGTFLRLHHAGTRLVDFTVRGKKYTFDPNRIFTLLGIKNTLTKYGGTSPEAEAAVAGFSGALIKKIMADSLPVLAVHNNTPDNYSALSYLTEYKNDADSVWVVPGGDADDFFFVISSGAFSFFKKENFSCVLQNNANVTDDGSLSVYCGNAGIPYVNIEAEHLHLDAQYRMLQTAARWAVMQHSKKNTLRKAHK